MVVHEPVVKEFDSYEKMIKYLSIARNIETASFTSGNNGNWFLHIEKKFK